MCRVASVAVRVRVHNGTVRFTFDRAPFRHMYRALLDVTDAHGARRTGARAQLADTRDGDDGAAKAAGGAPAQSAFTFGDFDSDDDVEGDRDAAGGTADPLIEALFPEWSHLSLPHWCMPAPASTGAGAHVEERSPQQTHWTEAETTEMVVACEHQISMLAFDDDSGMKWHNESLNEEQRLAVAAVLKGWHGTAPFVIHGPPGTGKTMTVTEAVWQLYSRDPTATILVVAPSESAADVITERLARYAVPHEDMLYINSHRRLMASLNLAVSRYTRSDVGGQFTVPTLDEILSHRIVACTCVMAGVMISLGVRAGHFTHIIADESSQAMEPEMLVPLSLVSRATRVVLAGDPCQLGAILRSAAAAASGLSVSLQERLVERSVYKTCRTVCSVMLRDNYRSHPGLIELNSRMFYDNKLRASADPAVTKSMTAWEALPIGNDFPLLMVGVEGEDRHELDSPSFWNGEEASMIVDLVVRLMSSKTVRVSTRDIGVITVYRKQVLVLRKLLKAEGYGQVRVGTVDNYQGQEAKIVLISTVLSNKFGPAAATAADRKRRALEVAERRGRSSADTGGAASSGGAAVSAGAAAKAAGGDETAAAGIGSSARVETAGDLDETGAGAADGAAGAGAGGGSDRGKKRRLFGSVGVGLMGDGKRYNVALTRAKALTVVVGNPLVLKRDPCWLQLLRWCTSHDSYTGCHCPGIGLELAGDIETDAAAMLESIANETMQLGAGDVDKVYPSDPADFFRDDAEFRVMLAE